MTFGFESTTDEVLAGLQLAGTVAVITGASTGLGEETARALAARGAAVTMMVRDLAKGVRAAQRIREAHPEAELRLEPLDLSSLADARAAGERVAASHPRIDVLINNAGVMACPFERTVDGWEVQFGTNHLGHFLFTHLLASSLLDGPPSRLISLSSRGHAFADVDLDDPNFELSAYDEFTAYGRSKTANALFAVGAQLQWGGRGLTALSVHPGGIHTELGRHMTPAVLDGLQQRVAAMGRTFRWKSIPQGAATTVWAATAPELAEHGGAYCEDCSVATVDDDPAAPNGVRSYAVDPDSASQLWEESCRWVGVSAR
jgi:NAD(P)-dependent dehydrogenase (short-subunit alcohol dehydrogenase family)